MFALKTMDLRKYLQELKNKVIDAQQKLQIASSAEYSLYEIVSTLEAYLKSFNSRPLKLHLYSFGSQRSQSSLCI